jgi:WD40 repeat protein
MSPTTPPGDDALTPELVVRLEAACDRFEAAWQAAGRPALEDYLATMPAEGRLVLFRELAAIELAYRRHGGERPEPEEYRARYPAWVAAVDAAFAAVLEGDDRGTTTGFDPEANADQVTVASSRSNGSKASEPAKCPKFLGDYEVLDEIGRGGMGIVYRARQVSLNRPVALKLLRSGVLAGEDELRRFQNEAEAVAQLDHPGIVPVYEVGEHEDQRYFSMKLVQGGNLAGRMATYRYCEDPKAIAALLIEMAEAVHHAHMRGILHRDLKPANILVDDQGHPHITDFGLAKRVDADAELTAMGAILGTPAYMAPEQALGKRGVITTATDVHGIGAVLYALLTRRPPFVGDSVVDTLTQVKERLPDAPRRLNPKVPRDLEVICLKCMEKDPRRRYSSAQAVADDLRAWQDGRPIAARPVGALERAVLFVRRRPALAATYALTAALLLLAGLGSNIAWLWWASETARNESEVARDNEAFVRADLDRQRDKAERFDYGRTIEMIQREWRASNAPSAQAVLNRTRRDLRGWEWRYVSNLWNSQGAEILALKGHTRGVSSASFSPDGTRIVTASQDGTAKLWDARTGVEILTVRGHSGTVWSASFSPDGLRILTASEDGTTGVWDAKTGDEVFRLKGHTAIVRSASFSPDGSQIVTAGQDKTAKVWNAKTGAEIFTFKEHRDTVWSASFSPDGSRIVTASEDATARVWDARTGAEFLTLAADRPAFKAPAGYSSGFWSASLNPDGSRIVTAGQHQKPKLWYANAKTGLTPFVLTTFSLDPDASLLRSAGFNPDGSRIVTGGQDGAARLWDVTVGAEVLCLKGHTGPVASASFSPDGSRIVTASEDGTAMVWDARARHEILTLEVHPNTPDSASFSPDGSRILTTCIDGLTSVRDARTGAQILTVKGRGSPRLTPAWFSPDGSRILTLNEDRKPKVWDTRTGAELLHLRDLDNLDFSASFSPDGSRLLTLSENRKAMVWDTQTGAQVLHVGGPDKNKLAWSALFSPDGSRLLTMIEGNATVWDTRTGAELFHLERLNTLFFWERFNPETQTGVDLFHLRGFDSVSASFDSHKRIRPLSPQRIRLLSPLFSPDGSRLLTLTYDRRTKVLSWNLRDTGTGAELLNLRSNGYNGRSFSAWPSPDLSASFSPDGSRLLTSIWDGTAKVTKCKLWDTKTGAELLDLGGNGTKSQSFSAWFSADGSRLLTTTRDGTAKVANCKLWDTKTGTELLQLKLASSDWLTFSPDGSRILTTEGPSGRKLWDTKTGTELLQLKLVSSAWFSPDGSRLLTSSYGSYGNIANVWDTRTGAEVLALRGHTDRIESTSFSPDGSRIVTASVDGTIKVWDARAVSHTEADQGKPAENQTTPLR